MDEKVPVIIPHVTTSAKGRMTSPPKMTKAKVAPNVVPDVNTVLGNVSLMERFNISIRF